MIARKPQGLSHLETASVPVVAVTARQMLFDYAQAKPGQSVLIHGTAGNVGAYAVQLAKQAGLLVFATASSEDAVCPKSRRHECYRLQEPEIRTGCTTD